MDSIRASVPRSMGTRALERAGKRMVGANGSDGARRPDGATGAVSGDRPTVRKPEALGNAGGYSGARLWRYESGRGWLVARAWPQDGPSRAGLEQIHRWLDEAAGLGFVPVPLPALDGRTVHEQGGRLWDVSPWLEGAAAPERPPLRPRLRSGFAALAAFHQALRRERTRGPSPGIQARLRELEGLLRDGFDALEHALDRAAADPRSTAPGAGCRWRERLGGGSSNRCVGHRGASSRCNHASATRNPSTCSFRATA